MPDLEALIGDWRQRMAAGGLDDPAVLDELESHLREQADELIRSGTDPEGAFRIAAGRIGEARALRPEFAKVERRRVALFRNTPLALKILAAGFVLMGLSGLSFLPLLGLGSVSANVPGIISCTALCGVQFMIGAGLWQRRNFWRCCALGWAALYLLVGIAFLRPFGGVVGHFVFAGLDSRVDLAARIAGLSHWQLVWLTRVADFRHVIDCLGPALLLWGIYFLTRPAVARLFRSRAEVAAG